ncbi:hypothetical protein BFP76_02115 [Amylibacter kogurei]|uniref:DUF4864 domain-containing protein n=1 Tax=Paramylibacter kogurei TaxID=1889778 RepID=A0A2G5K4V9_9RHOB|nr:DUF4864 domain-containing protein [Amylibacter kogurei]PIB24062.1 hypothetical protein BFP76_02115 [Amylibacter kogurei]
MKKLLISLTMMLCIAFPMQARNNDIESVISDQFKAFQMDDFERAYEFASPNIQRMYGDVDRFSQMVTNGYPMVHRPSRIEFKEQQEKGGVIYQYVYIIDQQGRGFIAEYAMIEMENGWKINGVDIQRSKDIGV